MAAVIISVVFEMDLVTKFSRFLMKVMSVVGSILDFGLMANPAARSARATAWMACAATLRARAVITPPPPCISYALVQAIVGVGTVIIVYVILITYKM